MQRSVDAVRGVVAVDQPYSQQLESLPDRFQARADSLGLSDALKEAFRKAYGDSKPFMIRREALEVDKQWAGTTVAFYEFAMANATKIRVDGSHLRIGNERIRAEFNEQLKQSLTLRNSVNTMNAQIEGSQREIMQRTGMTLKEMGLEDTSQSEAKK